MDKNNDGIIVTYRGIQIMKNSECLCHCYECTKIERKAIDEKLAIEKCVSCRNKKVCIMRSNGIAVTKCIEYSYDIENCSAYVSNPTDEMKKSGVINCTRPENSSGKCEKGFCIFGKI